MKKVSSTILLIVLSIVSGSWVAADWPQFRGADRSGRSQETNLLQAWDGSGPEQAWISKDIGLGYAGPAIADGKIFILGTQRGDEYLYCLDEESGKILWSTEIASLLKNNWGDGPRGTPAVDGDRVYAMSGQGTLVCAAVADGEVLWKKTMKSLGGKIQKWGYTESVLVDGDLVLCTPGGNKGTMAALNKLTGKVVWQSKDWKENAQYASIVPAEMHGVKQYVQLTQKQLAGIAAKDGRLLWKADFRGGRTAVVPTPVVYDNRVYITAGYGAGCIQIEVSEDQSVSTNYSNKVMKNHHGGVIRVGDYIYGYSDAVGWVCQDWEAGDVVWAEKQKLGKGAIGYADGKLYCLEERSGKVVLIDASPNGWKELGQITLSPQSELRSAKGRVWTHPVIANGKLYLRDQELFYCFDVSG
ncbi:MAG: PQQ-like beta-propeller repeat protein [Opitutales bacterium]|nr:PQQ-like beta-propeller repeat protein [Opitutales bacterium]MDG2170057.1 PQQ-like beta-propeller repeat protein [Opitutales bacterium]